MTRAARWLAGPGYPLTTAPPIEEDSVEIVVKCAQRTLKKTELQSLLEIAAVFPVERVASLDVVRPPAAPVPRPSDDSAAELRRYVRVVSVDDDLASAAARLAASGMVEAAYVKPGVQPPIAPDEDSVA